MRLFASEQVPATSGNTGSGDNTITQYVNGELVRRTALTLKKHEDIEG
jgi:hypothetical protein